MLRWLAALISSIFIVSFTNVSAEDSSEFIKTLDPPLEEIQEIISEQILAFRQNNAEEAYAFASSFIKSKFPSPSRFMAMVKGSYPMIWNPQEFKFIEQRGHASNIIQRVVFTDEDDSLFFFDYLMIKSEETWVIHGVYLVEAGGAGA